MKIFAVAGVYDAVPTVDVALGKQEQPIWYEIPDSSISRSGNPFFVPDTGSAYVAFPSVAFRICKLGKSVATRFSHRYYDAATLGFSVVAVDILRELRRAGLPWTRAVAFDRSCLLGNFMPISSFIQLEEFCIKCGSASEKYSCKDAISGIDAAISLISADNTIKTGDIILSALSPAGIALNIGDRFTVEANETTIFDINVK